MAGFLWTTANVESATKHGVTVADAEHVVRHQRAPWPEAVGGPDVWRVWGRTEAGEYVEVMYRVLTDDTNVDYAEVESIDVAEEGDTFLVFHARFLTAAEKRRYRRRSQ